MNYPTDGTFEIVNNRYDATHYTSKKIAKDIIKEFKLNAEVECFAHYITIKLK